VTEREIWLKYGPDALHRGAAEIRQLVPVGPLGHATILAVVMQRFGRDFADVYHVLRAINADVDPLTPWDRLVVEVVLAVRQARARLRRLSHKK
jgi:hypothetical protein